jgi:hypothetical protein
MDDPDVAFAIALKSVPKLIANAGRKDLQCRLHKKWRQKLALDRCKTPNRGSLLVFRIWYQKPVANAGKKGLPQIN